jgi:hypothetical protein
MGPIIAWFVFNGNYFGSFNKIRILFESNPLRDQDDQTKDQNK